MIKETGLKLKELREEAGMTRRELHEKTGISIATIIYIEEGTRSTTLETVEKILIALGHDSDELLR